MKRAYVRPTMVGERFVANEYVAACGESRKVFRSSYIFSPITTFFPYIFPCVYSSISVRQHR